MALEAKVVIKPSNGWYSRVDADGVVENKKVRAKDTDSGEFWLPVMKNPLFKEFIEKNYKASHSAILSDVDIASEFEDET